ncbi:unnamed protein product [Callosobruchus maculatus]|uniref:Uncharacterized protein n=1 Tax=Callosobruchus maculatus TaxID=64391 RepID=A0A653BKE2_CALMS|nr:unnamed protein product [Callosobruchus maculatus]
MRRNLYLNTLLKNYQTLLLPNICEYRVVSLILSRQIVIHRKALK